MPETPADQVLWTVTNDLDESTTLAFLGCESLGLEAQFTLWGYKSTGALGGTFFRSVKIINKGGVTIDSARVQRGSFWIDSMYVAQWSDPDVGDLWDDLAGCDTLQQCGYVYNAHPVDRHFAAFSLQDAAGLCSAGRLDRYVIPLSSGHTPEPFSAVRRSRSAQGLC